jgi:hypothetical protein
MEANNEISIIVVRGSAFDLTRLDFSFANYQFVPINSLLIEEYLGITSGRTSEYLERVRSETTLGRWEPSKAAYAILPIDPNNASTVKALRCLWLLTIVYPSDIYRAYDIRLWRHSPDHVIDTMLVVHDDQSSFNPLDISENRLEELHDFVQLVFDRVGNDGFASQVIDLYLQSKQSSLTYHRYLSLMMALETILASTSEIVYRLKRAVAVILGRTLENSSMFFQMVDYMYGLRSKIVHGEKFDRDEVNYYLPTLEQLVSRLIIELLVHNIEKKETVGEIVTRLGFGDYKKISEGHKEFILNDETYALFDLESYSKYKKAK